MANLITFSRLLLLMAVVALAYQPPSAWQLLAVLVLILVFVTDGLDGYVARRRNEVSLFGAMFDIAGDRIVELTMWIVLADLNLVPIWVPLVFVIRGVIVDTIRAVQSGGSRESPFSLIEMPLGQWLVAGKFMRIFYAVLKAVVFCWLLLVYPLPVIAPEIWSEWAPVLTAVGTAMTYLAVMICIARGLPVIVEFTYAERDSILGSLGNDARRGGRK